MKKDFLKIIRALAASGASPEEIARQPMIKQAGITVEEVRQFLGIGTRPETPPPPPPPEFEPPEPEPRRPEPSRPESGPETSGFMGKFGSLAAKFGRRGVHHAGRVTASIIEKRAGMIGSKAGDLIRRMTRDRSGRSKRIREGRAGVSGGESLLTAIDTATKSTVDAVSKVEKKFDDVMGKLDVSIKDATSKITGAIEDTAKILRTQRVRRFETRMEDTAAREAGKEPVAGGRTKLRTAGGIAAAGAVGLGAGMLLRSDQAHASTDANSSHYTANSRPTPAANTPSPTPIPVPTQGSSREGRPDEIDFSADRIVFQAHEITGLGRDEAVGGPTSPPTPASSGPAPNSSIPPPPAGAFQPDATPPTPQQEASPLKPKSLRKWAQRKGVGRPKKTSRLLSGRERQAMDFFMSKGWTREQAAGIVGNLVTESHLSTTARGDHGEATGLAQWHPDRWADFQRFLKKNGGDSSDFQSQLAFVDYELRHKESGAGGRLLQARSVREAADAAIGYERPEGWSLRHPERGMNFTGRLENAEEVYRMSLADRDRRTSRVPGPTPDRGRALNAASIQRAAKGMAHPATPEATGKTSRLPDVQASPPNPNIDPGRFGGGSDPLPTSKVDHFKNFPGLGDRTPHPGLGS